VAAAQLACVAAHVPSMLVQAGVFERSAAFD
jgi:hypothetical protein